MMDLYGRLAMKGWILAGSVAKPRSSLEVRVSEPLSIKALIESPRSRFVSQADDSHGDRHFRNLPQPSLALPLQQKAMLHRIRVSVRLLRKCQGSHEETDWNRPPKGQRCTLRICTLGSRDGDVRGEGPPTELWDHHFELRADFTKHSPPTLLGDQKVKGLLSRVPVKRAHRKGSAVNFDVEGLEGIKCALNPLNEIGEFVFRISYRGENGNVVVFRRVELNPRWRITEEAREMFRKLAREAHLKEVLTLLHIGCLTLPFLPVFMRVQFF